ncbi:hypothetical protein LWP59_12330 [Amycolatopsis acidiphila]|uniref:Chaplin n=1 Tax=Amycolatopsis acidiphila TaxID=715473 RepID=A0A558ALT8_9PSEU|nr:hypothetical protein [Amycolatopsis acidiphila]TVT25225.1 hypothetical protein FNH06_02815 [Amycolatopsis acidiphila]UIJ62341.1 hypothetical protein LWP59_12330 [Amycolatopsis acidiphila]GHG83146.1 hypothetical protein GCM10017788_53980 [Amycolatopsis acidiphila]
MLRRFGLIAMGAGVVLGGFASGGQASAQGITPVTMDGVDAMRHLDIPPALCRSNLTVPLVQVPVQQVLDNGSPDRCASGRGS